MKRSPNTVFFLRSCLMASATMLAACSGGGGEAGAADPVAAVPPSPPVPSPPPPPPPQPTLPPPSGTSDTFATAQSTSRFLTQSTFGPTDEVVTSLVGTDVSDWLLAEFDKPGTSSLSDLDIEVARVGGEPAFNFVFGNATTSTFWRDAIQGDAQLRDRTAYALSQILVPRPLAGNF